MYYNNLPLLMGVFVAAGICVTVTVAVTVSVIVVIISVRKNKINM